MKVTMVEATVTLTDRYKKLGEDLEAAEREQSRLKKEVARLEADVHSGSARRMNRWFHITLATTRARRRKK